MMQQQQLQKQGSMPMGFRFDPSDEDLIDYYLRNKLCGNSSAVPDYLIMDLDIYRHHPQDLPHGDAAFPYRHHMRDSEMYFFTPRHPTSPASTRVNRSAGGGLWDGHAKYDEIIKNRRVIGRKTQLNFKILVNGNKKKIKTDWIMHEYRLNSDPDPASGDEKEEFDAMVLCRIYRMNKKASGAAQSYDAASFGEEEDQDGGYLPKRKRIEEPGTSMQLYMSSVPAQPWEEGCEPLAYSDADYHEPSFPSSVPMMSGVANDYWSSSTAMVSSDTGDHASTSASTIPQMRFADYGAFAQPPTNIPIDQSLTTIGAEYQVASAGYEVPTEEPVDDIEEWIKCLDGSLTVEPVYNIEIWRKCLEGSPTVEPESSIDAGNITEEPINDDNDGDDAFVKSQEVDLTESSNDAGNLTVEPVDDDDDGLDAFAKSLELDLTEETLTSHDAGNHATPSSLQNMSLPLEGSHEPLPLMSSDVSNRGSSSALTIPMTIVPDEHHVSAQAQANVLPEEPSVSCDAENQVQTMGSVAGEVPDDDTLPPFQYCFPDCDLDTIVSSMKDFDHSCFSNIDEFLEDI